MKVSIKTLAYNKKGQSTIETIEFNSFEHVILSKCINIAILQYIETLTTNGYPKLQYKIMSMDWKKPLKKWRSDKKTFNVWIESYSHLNIFHNQRTYYTALEFKQIGAMNDR